MKLYSWPLWMALIVAITSCGESKSKGNGVCEKNADFPKVVSVPDSAVELDAIIRIDEWNVGDSALVCLSQHTDKLFYRFDLDNFQTIDSFGVEGQGPGEFLSPKLVKSAHKRTILADSQNRNFIEIKGNEKTEIKCPDVWMLFNQLCDVNYPIVCMYELGRDSEMNEVFKWNTMDVTTGEKIDSIYFNRYDKAFPDMRMYLSTSTNGKYIVFITIPKDEFQIAEVSPEGKIIERTIYKGSKETSNERPYYVDVVCGKDYIYLLSAKNAQFSKDDISGNSEVEIYDYDGNPVALLQLDVISIKMMLDEDRGRLLLTSPLDEDIHIVQLPEL
ncbi:MAG: TolB-like 6-bladed beta-propeller domain-containing protein [Muribaculaceae bacterium]|nr:TolB-like 6-bladed beta-propeller domain-containing protein [Muribaculaceae bacterium]